MSTDNKDAVRVALDALLTRIDDAFDSYERFGGICKFEDEPMIHASMLTEIVDLRGALHVATIAAAPAHAAHAAQAERIAALSAALAIAEAALADIGDADREPGDDVAWCESRAAEALPAVRAVMDRPSRPHVQQPAAITARDLSARDATSVSDMCALLDKHFIKRSEYTDCTILYSVTFDQLRNLYDEGRALRSQPAALVASARPSAAQGKAAQEHSDLTTVDCPICNGKGMVGGHRGQTPESYEEVTEGCDECHGQGKIIAAKADRAAQLAAHGEAREDAAAWWDTQERIRDLEATIKSMKRKGFAAPVPAPPALTELGIAEAVRDWFPDRANQAEYFARALMTGQQHWTKRHPSPQGAENNNEGAK